MSRSVRYRRLPLVMSFVWLGCAGPVDRPIDVHLVRAGDTTTFRLDDPALDRGWRPDPRGTCLDQHLVDELALDAVAGAAFLGGPVVAVGNARSHNIVLYSDDGAWRTIGRRGTGPGEFEAITWVGRLAADTGLAYDARLRRASAFTWNDGVVWSASIPVPPPEDGTTVAGVAGSVADGRIVVITYGAPVHDPGRHRIPLVVYLWDRSAAGLERWVTGAGREVQLIDLDGPGVGLLTPLFQLESLVRVAGDMVVIADTDRLAVRMLTSTRESVQLEIGVPPQPLTRNDLARALNELEADGRRVSPVVKEALAALAPSNLPLIGGMHAASTERVVVRARVSDGRGGNGHTWWVLSPQGEIIAQSPEPQGLDIIDIWEGRALSLSQTPWGVRVPCIHQIHEVD